MQQFLWVIVFSAYVLAPARAEPLTTAQTVCGSRASVGDFDVKKPASKPEKPKEASEAQKVIAFVPIETALGGSLNAPTAYHGAITVTAPKYDPAGYKGECQPLPTKPVAAAPSAP